ncbi:MAG: DUF3021 domain-containing protein [Oscillospiraceae bacterium]|nr:DUF3021 domain-containing protein [Oscillospiraceae bacterium]
MTEKKKLLVRAIIGGVTAKLLLLGFWVWFHLTGWSPQGTVPVGDFTLAAGATVAMFGSYWLAVVVEFTCIFALGASIGIATMPFADDTRSLLKDSFVHFIVTGALVLLNAWVFCLLDWGWRLLLIPYTLLYLLIWFGRWVGWYVEVAQIKVKLGLAPAHSPLKWRETLPYLPFLLVLCIVLPIALVWADLFFFAGSFPMLSGLLMPYILFPVVGLCSGISLGKRQGFCVLYPVAAYLLYVPIVFWLFNYTALFHADLLFTFALIGNIIGAVHRKCKQDKEVSP